MWRIRIPQVTRVATMSSNPLHTQQRKHSCGTHSHSHSHSHRHSHGEMENVVGEHLRKCKVATAVGCATNIFFSATKIWFGSSGGSVALVADGFHSLTDILADAISYASISLSQKQLPRCRFPFGIGRLETTGAVVVATILLLGGVTLFIQAIQLCLADILNLAAGFGISGGGATLLSYVSFLGSHGDDTDEHSHSHGGHAHGEHPHSGHSHFQVSEFDEASGTHKIMWVMVVLAASSVVCKEALFHWTRRVGKQAGSRVVIANAHHHRADAWSGAVALVGVAGQMVGIPGIDGLAGLIVSLSICKVGYGLLKDSILEFFDFQSAEDVPRVREQLQKYHLKFQGQTMVTDTSPGGSPPQSPSRMSETDNTAAGSRGLGKRIRFINVFLMRHGHTYALHVSLLVGESMSAQQIQEATDMLTALAKESLPINDTFITLNLCSPDIVPRSELNSTSSVGKMANPSLDAIIRNVSTFHGFSHALSYDWEKKYLFVPCALVGECRLDVETVAQMFSMQLRDA